MKVSVIIAFYKNLPFLDLILSGLKRQVYNDFEVILAEDDEAPETLEYLKRRTRELPFVVKHVHQQDLGFRKNRVLNKAVSVAAGEFLVFLDGDCIPHSHLLNEYAGMAREGVVFCGRRVMVSEMLTKKLLVADKLKLLSLYYQLKYGSKRVEDGLYLPFFRKKKTNGIMGCNWGILRKHILEVNGFDEDYISAGVGEDVDIEWRLVGKGVKLQSVKHRAIVYHLHHKTHYTLEEAEPNYRLLRAKKAAGHLYCLHGLQAKE